MFFANLTTSCLQETLVADYLNSKCIDEAINAVKEMKVPKHFLSEMLNKIIVYSLDRSDDDKEHASLLIHALCSEGIATGDNLLQVMLKKYKKHEQLWFCIFLNIRVTSCFLLSRLSLLFWTRAPR